MLWIICGIIVSYLIGSLPTAYIYGRLVKGIDIRKHGSGNIGATNALRVFGKKAGGFVLFIDIMKGAIPVILIGNSLVFNNPAVPSDLTRILLGMSAIFGHNWTIFLGFKGGKGVATSLGVLIAMAYSIQEFAIALGIVIIVWFLVFFIYRVVSLASIISGAVFPVVIICSKSSLTLIIFSIVIALFLIIRHLPNIKRLLQGKEPKLKFKKTSY